MIQPHPATPVTRPGRDVVPFRQAVRAWVAISLQAFGGPAGQIAVMQRELVEERRWIGPQRFLHALKYCMLLPGPSPATATPDCPTARRDPQSRIVVISSAALQASSVEVPR